MITLNLSGDFIAFEENNADNYVMKSWKWKMNSFQAFGKGIVI
jgi:hypothetical protein